MSYRALYAGSFDPFTNGHLDVVRQAADIFDGLIVAIAQNSGKGPRHYPAIEVQTAIKNMLKREEIFNCNVVIANGLTTRECRTLGARYLIRGIRSTSDFLNEEDMARVNHMLDPDIKTVYLRAENNALSSSMVRELLKYGQDVSQYVPPEIKALIDKYS